MTVEKQNIQKEKIRQYQERIVGRLTFMLVIFTITSFLMGGATISTYQQERAEDIGLLLPDPIPLEEQISDAALLEEVLAEQQRLADRQVSKVPNGPYIFIGLLSFTLCLVASTLMLFFYRKGLKEHLETNEFEELRDAGVYFLWFWFCFASMLGSLFFLNMQLGFVRKFWGGIF